MENIENLPIPALKPQNQQKQMENLIGFEDLLENQEITEQKVETYPCEFCGRKFNEKSLEKHQNICQKVFQKKNNNNNSKVKEITKDVENLSLQEKKGSKKFQESKLSACESCGRKFNEISLEKHQKNCEKVFKNKRKVFDAKKQRVGVQREEVLLKNQFQECKIVDGIQKLETCQSCQRKFNEISFQKHQKICQKVFQSKRETFGNQRVTKEMLKAQEKIKKLKDLKFQEFQELKEQQENEIKEIDENIQNNDQEEIRKALTLLKQKMEKMKNNQQQEKEQEQEQENSIELEIDVLDNEQQLPDNFSDCQQYLSVCQLDIEQVESREEEQNQQQENQQQYECISPKSYQGEENPVMNYSGPIDDYIRSVSKYNQEVSPCISPCLSPKIQQTNNNNKFINQMQNVEIGYEQLQSSDDLLVLSEFYEKQEKMKNQNLGDLYEEQYQMELNYIKKMEQDKIKAQKMIQDQIDSNDLLFRGLEIVHIENLSNDQFMQLVNQKKYLNSYKYQVKAGLLDRFIEIISTLIKAQNDSDNIIRLTEQNQLLELCKQKVFNKKLLQIYEILLCKKGISFVKSLFLKIVNDCLQNFNDFKSQNQIIEILKNACSIKIVREALINFIIGENGENLKSNKCVKVQEKKVKIVQMLVKKFQVKDFGDKIEKNLVIFISEMSNHCKGEIRQISKELMEIIIEQGGHYKINDFYQFGFNKDVIKAYNIYFLQKQQEDRIEEEQQLKIENCQRMKEQHIEIIEKQKLQKQQLLQQNQQGKCQSKWRKQREQFLNAICQQKLQQQQQQDEILQNNNQQQQQKLDQQFKKLLEKANQNQNVQEIKKNKVKNQWKQQSQQFRECLKLQRMQGEQGQIPEMDQFQFNLQSDERIAYVQSNIKEQQQQENLIRNLENLEQDQLVVQIQQISQRKSGLNLKVQNIVLQQYLEKIQGELKNENEEKKKIFYFKRKIEDLTNGIDFYYFTEKQVFQENLFKICEILCNQPIFSEICNLNQQILEIMLKFVNGNCGINESICRIFAKIYGKNKNLQGKIQNLVFECKDLVSKNYKVGLKVLGVLKNIIGNCGIYTFANQFKLYEFIAFTTNHQNQNVRQKSIELLCAIYEQTGKSLFCYEGNEKFNKYVIQKVKQECKEKVLKKFNDQQEEALVESDNCKLLINYEKNVFDIKDLGDEENVYYWLMECVIQYCNLQNTEMADRFIKDVLIFDNKQIENGKGWQILMNHIFNFMKNKNQLVVVNCMKLLSYVVKKVQNQMDRIKDLQNISPLFEYLWYLMLFDQNGLPVNLIQRVVFELLKYKVVNEIEVLKLTISHLQSQQVSEYSIQKTSNVIIYLINNLEMKFNELSIEFVKQIIKQLVALLNDEQVCVNVKTVGINLLGLFQFNIGNDNVQVFGLIQNNVEDVNKMKINSQSQKYALIYHNKVMKQNKKKQQKEGDMELEFQGKKNVSFYI